ncbi:unnamed protein product [Rhodiola kirilowii]
MGGCATKPKVEGEKAAAAPVTEEEVVGDGEKVGMADRGIVEVGEKSEAVSRRQSLSNLLNEAEEEKDTANGNDQLTGSSEQELKSQSESVKQELAPENGAQSTELTKQKLPSDLAKQVPAVAEETFDDCKSELAEAETPELIVPQVVKSEALKVVEVATPKLEEVTAVIPASSETSKPVEVIKTDNAAPVVLKSETPKPSEVSKTEVATPVALKSETPTPSEVSKTEIAAPVVTKSETPKPSEVTKTEDVATVVLKPETPKPSEVSKTEDPAPVVLKSEVPKPSEVKKEDVSAPMLTETPKPSEPTKTTFVPVETKNNVEVKEAPLKVAHEKTLEETKTKSSEQKPTASESAKA